MLTKPDANRLRAVANRHCAGHVLLAGSKKGEGVRELLDADLALTRSRNLNVGPRNAPVPFLRARHRSRGADESVNP